MGSIWRIYSILWSSTLLSVHAVAVPANHASCNVPAVMEGQTTTLTCFFNEDFGDERKSVGIMRYTPEGESTVLLCDMSSGKPNCQSEQDYAFAGNENGTLHLLIPRASQKHVGQYSCLLLNSPHDNTDKCRFLLKRAESTCSIPAVRIGQTTELTCQFNEDMSKLQKNITITHYTRDSEETVLLCQWVNGSPSCQSKHGFAFSGIITDTLIMFIPHARQEYSGDYRCNVLDAADDSNESCTFTVLDSTKVISAREDAPESDILRESTGNMLDQETFVIILTVVALSVTVILVVVSACICWKCTRNGRKLSDVEIHDRDVLIEKQTRIDAVKAALLDDRKHSIIYKNSSKS